MFQIVQFQNLPPSQGEVLLGAVAEDGDRDDDGDGREGAAEGHAEDDLPRGLDGVRVGGAPLEQVGGEQAAGILKFQLFWTGNLNRNNLATWSSGRQSCRVGRRRI